MHACLNLTLAWFFCFALAGVVEASVGSLAPVASDQSPYRHGRPRNKVAVRGVMLLPKGHVRVAHANNEWLALDEGRIGRWKCSLGYFNLFQLSGLWTDGRDYIHTTLRTDILADVILRNPLQERNSIHLSLDWPDIGVRTDICRGFVAGIEIDGHEENSRRPLWVVSCMRPRRENPGAIGLNRGVFGFKNAPDNARSSGSGEDRGDSRYYIERAGYGNLAFPKFGLLGFVPFVGGAWLNGYGLRKARVFSVIFGWLLMVIGGAFPAFYLLVYVADKFV